MKRAMGKRLGAHAFDSFVLGLALPRFIVLVVSCVLLVICSVCFSIASADVAARLYAFEVDPLFPHGLKHVDGASLFEGDATEDASDAAGGEVPSSNQRGVLALVSEPLQSVRDAIQSSASGVPSGGANNQPASNPSSPSDLPSTPQTPSEPVETGPSEEEEQAYLQHLRSSYDALPGLYSEINSGWNSFRSEALASTESSRADKWSHYLDLSNRTAQAEMRFSNFQMPDGSRYDEERQRIQDLYTDLGNAAALLAQSWGRCNTDFDDESVWMAPFNQYSSGGRITYLLDYESKVKGARP